MKILVTGGAGFIGSAVVRLAIMRGHTVINVDVLTYAACLENVASVSENPLYKLEKVDIRDGEELDRIFVKYAPDLVMHLAAESHVDRSIDAPADFIETNITGTFNVLEAARKYWMQQVSQRPSAFTIFRRMRFLAHCHPINRSSLLKTQPTIRVARMQPQKLAPIILYGHGTRHMVCLWLSRIAQTIMAPFTSRRS